MITIYVPEFKDFDIFRDRYGYTVRKHWVTKAGVDRNDVVGCAGNILGAVGIIERFLRNNTTEKGTFTLKDLELMQESIGAKTIDHTSVLDKYKTQIKAFWTKASHPSMPKVSKNLKELDKQYKLTSQELFEFKVFEYTRMFANHTQDSFNYVLKTHYKNGKGELKVKEAWTCYPSSLSLLVDSAIHSEVYCRLDGNKVDINTYIATYIAFISAFCDDINRNPILVAA